MILRDYQTKAINSVLNKKENTIIVSPTGSGKSIIIVELIKRLKAKKTLIFQPSIHILKQNVSHYEDSTGLKASIMSASAKSHDVGNVTFSTIGTAKNQIDKFLDVDLIILDEVHNLDPLKAKTMYQKFLKAINYKGIIIGLTATTSRN